VSHKTVKSRKIAIMGARRIFPGLGKLGVWGRKS